MDVKTLGEQLAFDIVEIATRHHILSEVIAERLLEDLTEMQVLALDKELIIEGAVEEFRKTFAASFAEVLENIEDED
jgi:hypothetical protein